MKLTEWFPGDVKPVRVGVYQRKHPKTGDVVYSKWDGEDWCSYMPTKKMAAIQEWSSQYQKLPWRGIAGKPQ